MTPMAADLPFLPIGAVDAALSGIAELQQNAKTKKPDAVMRRALRLTGRS